jgi:hypothetical protein
MLPFGQLKNPLMMPLKFPLDTINRSKNIVGTPVSATCIHIVCFILFNFPLNVPSYIFLISSILVVLATEVLVLVIVVAVVIVVVVAEAPVFVVIVLCKYGLLGQLIISFIIF